MARRTFGKLNKRSRKGIVARERLFALLERWRERPLLWVAGPPGAGKTTLVASYLESRDLPTIWYTSEIGDADAAFFFQNLGESIPSRRNPLPVLSDEYRADLRAFCRRFWPLFFARIRAGSTLVIDGLLLALDAESIGVIVHQAVTDLPDGVRLIITSRSEPPPELAPLLIHQTMGILDWNELRFDLAETREATDEISGLDETQLRALHDTSAGWVAGLRMLIEHYRGGGQLMPGISAGGRDGLFNFLATEVFQQFPAATRNVLLRTSLLPHITRESAEALTGDKSAWQVLTELNQRHLFVDATNSTEPTYRYHALFKSFLNAHARTEIGAIELRSLQQRAAAHLAARGQATHAIPLYASAGDWVAAARLILLEANSLLARGQSQTLRGWVQALPTWYVQVTPRLLYCLGLSQCVLDPAVARATLERAYQRFLAERNALGQALAAAAIVQTYYFQFDAFDDLDPWIDALVELLEAEVVFPTAETELHVCSMLQIAITYRRPNDPFLAPCADRVQALITRGLDVNQSVAAAGLLVTYYDWFAPEKSRLLIGYVRPLLQAKELTPFNRLWWLLSEANHYYCEGAFDHAQDLFSKVRTIASTQGILPNHALLRMLDLMEAKANGFSLDQIDAFVEALDPTRRQEEQNFLSIAIPIALSRRDNARALAFAEGMLRSARDTGHRACEFEAHAWVATALCESGNAAEALTHLAAARNLVRDVVAPKIELHHLLIEANIQLKLGMLPIAQNAIGRALALARAHGYTNGFQLTPHILARLCAQALQYNIEPHYVQRLIQIHRLLPPTGETSDAWPWHVRIRVLGQVAIEVEGTPLVFGNKAQKKPIELLKALIAKGPRDVSQIVLIEALWPDSNGDASESALRMALHRLRKLFRRDDAVTISEGKLRLNERVCWVDAWLLDILCGNIDAMNDEDLIMQGDGLLALYKGSAFDGESDEPWMLLARERWRAKFLHAVGSIGQAEERRGAWERALSLYRRGIEIDPLSEDLYYNLMNCYLQQGKTAEAYSTYRRCKDVLSITLGVRPSPRTEALRQRVADLGASR
jgi:LuxR family transcriptional regulator, maltose regulon positive regulatory protein